MLEGGIIAKLLEEKWKTFAQVSLYGLYCLPFCILLSKSVFLILLSKGVFIPPWQGIFFKRMFVTLLHLLAMSVAIYSRHSRILMW